MRASPFLTLCVLACAGGLPACAGTADAPAPAADAALTSDPADSADAAEPTDVAAVDAAPDLPPIAPVPVDRLWLGVGDLPEVLMGRPDRGGTPFRWAVPPQGWTVEAHAEHAAAAAPTTAPVLEVEASDGSWIALPGAALTPGTWSAEPGGHRWQAEVAGELLPVGTWRLRVRLGAATALPIDLEVAERTAELDPFEDVDPWLVTFSRDREAVTVQAGEAGLQVVSTPQPAGNGTPDFVEALQILGLQGGDAAWNAGLRTLLLARVREHLHGFFLLDAATGEQVPGSVRVRILFEGDAALASLDPALLSRMAVGGDAPKIPGKDKLFGLAHVDVRNTGPDDDGQPGYGVFTTSMARAVLGNAVGAALLSDVLPATGGQPFGALPTDAKLLQPGLDPATLPPAERDRAGLFLFVLRFFSLGVAAITAHEMGHSLGLVAQGLPPHGLLGGVPGPWAVTLSDEHHLDTPGPNLMQTGASFDPAEILKDLPRFSPLELGYLRRQLLVLPKK